MVAVASTSSELLLVTAKIGWNFLLTFAENEEFLIMTGPTLSDTKSIHHLKFAMALHLNMALNVTEESWC